VTGSTVSNSDFRGVGINETKGRGLLSQGVLKRATMVIKVTLNKMLLPAAEILSLSSYFSNFFYSATVTRVLCVLNSEPEVPGFLRVPRETLYSPLTFSLYQSIHPYLTHRPPIQKLPKGYMALEINFVSARTIKRLLHHPYLTHHPPIIPPTHPSTTNPSTLLSVR
jgi:hypothetical protein